MGKTTTASVVKGAAEYRSQQGTDYKPGVSAETVGAEKLFLGIATLPPGQRTRAHVHERHESAFYMLSGSEVEMWSGPDLSFREIMRPGDYVFIPRNVLHISVNRSDVPAVFIGSRDEPTAQESVVLFPEMDARVP